MLLSNEINCYLTAQDVDNEPDDYIEKCINNDF